VPRVCGHSLDERTKGLYQPTKAVCIMARLPFWGTDDPGVEVRHRDGGGGSSF
jgi:hypothetical protein